MPEFTTLADRFEGKRFSSPNDAAYDMAGNLYEWCNDWFDCNLGTAPATDPVGPLEPASDSR